MTEEKTQDNTLIEKKVDTKSGQREMTVQKSSWSFRPKLEHKNRNTIKTEVPTIDKIARVCMQNQDADLEDAVNEELGGGDTATGSKQDSGDDVLELYRTLISYAVTEEYSNAVRPNKYDSTTVELQPYLFMEMVSETGDIVYASVSEPFKSENCRDLLLAVQSDTKVSLEYENGDPVLSVGNNSYQLVHARTVGQNGSIERDLVHELDQYSYDDSFIESEYDGWAKVPVKEVYDQNGCTIVETDNNDEFNWVFDEPVVWDETDDLVKLLETFANGDPDCLDFIYIRPKSPASSRYSVRTRSADNYNWEIALEEPTSNEKEIINESVMSFLDYATSAMLLAFITLLVLFTLNLTM